MAQETCRHRGCTCAARSDGFCSDYCAGHDAGAGGEGDLCACGHDVCAAPTKSESWEAVGELAPEGRFVTEERPRDW
ncbi:MAG: hypothetical protein QOG15_2497 [Solirubrobacteraceae bacterium]|jgi:hypothetical protein|nr:hypothetical protein [Solirubrobacteraceae bacterium]